MKTTNRPAGKSALQLAAGDTLVAFEWSLDRWRHLVSVAGAALLESIEGPAVPGGDPRWPASPVLTEVTAVTAGGRPAILGVGCAGRSHFSVSVAVHHDRPEMLLFEVACRIQEPAAWLGTTYRTADGRRVQAMPEAAAGCPPCTVRWAYAIGASGLVPWPAVAPPRSP